MKIPLKTMTAERKDCLAACAKVKLGEWLWHIHHEVIAEPMTYPVAERVRHINFKEAKERPMRFRMMRPISKAWLKKYPDILTLMEKYAEAYAKYLDYGEKFFAAEGPLSCGLQRAGVSIAVTVECYPAT